MNKHIKTTFPLLILLLVSSLAFKMQDFNSIASAIRTGNASALAANFEANVEITIKSAGNSYSKSQAEMVLKNFFTNNVPKAFSIVHTGNSPDGSKYFIGTLNTSTGTYRTYVLVKKVNNVMAIQEIRFEEP